MTRQEILEKIRAVVGSNYLDSPITNRVVFCFECGADITGGNAQPGQHIVTCPHGHIAERAFIFDRQVQWQFYDAQQPIANLSIPQGVTLPDGELLHFSVGMVIYRDSELLLDGQWTTVRQILLIRRTLHPRGFYALPAGHLERGEESDEGINLAAMREAHEETCLMVWRPRLLASLLLLEDDCRRGVDYHVWHLFEGKGEGKVCMDYESDIIGWYTRGEVQALRHKLVKPARDFFDMNLLFPL